MKKVIPVIAILGLFLAANQARAVAPDLIPVQGVLLDSAGDPVDTTVSAVFSIYTTETGGTALYTETQSVLVTDGLFTAYIGDVTTLDLTMFRDNDDLWLGINIDSDGEMPRVYLGSVPFAGYAEWCGNHPTPDFADITGTVDASDLPAGVVVGALACTGTDKVSGVDSSGTLVCSADVDTDTDTDTTYTAGTGLSLSGTVFSADTSVLQARVSSGCAAGSAIRSIDVSGGVACEADDNTMYSAGSGLDLSGTTFLVDPTDFMEPPTDSYTTSSVTTTGATVTIRSASINVPTSGVVVAIGKSEANCSTCATGEATWGYMTISSSSSANCMTGSYVGFWLGDWGAGEHFSTEAVMETFSVSAGSHTYYMRGCGNSGDSETTAYYYNQLLLFFIPT